MLVMQDSAWRESVKGRKRPRQIGGTPRTGKGNQGREEEDGLRTSKNKKRVKEGDRGSAMKGPNK